ncbi:MAG TPA: hypothetical protein VG225_16385 [Terracidiphilus sp.]|nr:hypothetical protein [Terracidiphilus sp.]
MLPIFALGFIALGHASAQSPITQAAMHARIKALYDFSPSKTTDAVRNSKSNEMDAFWNDVKSHRDTELPLLRKELEDSDNPRFFFADGSGLLLSLSEEPEDRKLAAGALARVDMADFQPHQYLMEVHALAVKGTNVTPAALHMLDDPKFTVYLPEHAYRLDQAACLQVALLPLSNGVWLPAVLERTKTEHDEMALKSLLMLLYYAQADDADRAIRTLAADAQFSPAIRDFATWILKHEKEIGTGKHPSPGLEKKLRAERRARMAAVSDEAMDDMNEMTEKIAQARTLAK